MSAFPQRFKMHLFGLTTHFAKSGKECCLIQNTLGNTEEISTIGNSKLKWTHQPLLERTHWWSSIACY